ncbi:MAG: hypothetical protein RXR08_14285 [Sulfolobaceae archaeon]
MIKIVSIINGDLILFSSSTKNLEVCKRIYVIYGGKLIEESYSKEPLHPYSLTLLNSKITIGNKGEKIPVREIGGPSDHGCPFHDYCDLMQKEKWLSIKCRLQDPPMFIVKGNRVFCWYYEKGVWASLNFHEFVSNSQPLGFTRVTGKSVTPPPL